MLAEDAFVCDVGTALYFAVFAHFHPLADVGQAPMEQPAPIFASFPMWHGHHATLFPSRSMR